MLVIWDLTYFVLDMNLGTNFVNYIWDIPLERVNLILTLHMGAEYILMEPGSKAKHVWIIADWNLVILIPADRW